MSQEIQETINSIWSQIEPFNHEIQEQILRQIGQKLNAHSEPKNAALRGLDKPKFHITDLGGAGIGVWTDPNADDATRIKQIDNFLRGERESWDR